MSRKQKSKEETKTQNTDMLRSAYGVELVLKKGDRKGKAERI